MEKVIFGKPNHELFKAMGQTCVDMHFHTVYSDGSVHIRSILQRAQAQGIGVAITDHNEIAGSLAASKNIEKVMIVPGIEVTTLDGPHLLFYFYSFSDLKDFFHKHIEPNRNQNPFMATKLSVPSLLERSQDYNCLRVAAHPFGYATSNSGLSKAIRKEHVDTSVMQDIEGLEVINGAINRRLNKRAVDQAFLQSRAFTGGSDGHSLMQLGTVLTISKASSRDEFLDNIRKKSNLVMGKEVGMIPKIVPITSTIRTHAIEYGIPSVKLQSRLMYSRAKTFKGRVVTKIHDKMDRIHSMGNRLNGFLKGKNY